jgi:hypothetical protein
MLAEKFLRKSGYIHKIVHDVSFHQLHSYVISRITSIYPNDIHASETQIGIENHRYCIVRLVVSTYFELRKHHIVKMNNIKSKGKNVRPHLTKTIIFKGQ